MALFVLSFHFSNRTEALVGNTDNGDDSRRSYRIRGMEQAVQRDQRRACARLDAQRHRNKERAFQEAAENCHLHNDYS